MVNTRNRSIDAIKGILIFLVVIGHVLPGSLDENVIRYVIYSFHMPAFFFVSGYLLDMKRLAGQNYPSVFSKYWRRMLLEWSVACLVYGCYVLRGGFDITGVIRYLYDPWYHLWFVPALFVMVSVLWLAYRIIRDDVVRYILLFAFGLLFYSLSHTEFAISRVFNCSLMFFVVLGMFSRERLSYIKIHSGGVTFVCILAILCVNLFMDSRMSFISTYMEVPIVGILCLLGILPVLQRGRFGGRVLEYWGRNSLRIYLWHVIPVVGLKWIFAEDEVMYYSTSMISILVCVGLTYSASRRPALRH